MPKVMECPHCKKRFPSTTYEMIIHIKEKCKEFKKLNVDKVKLNEKIYNR